MQRTCSVRVGTRDVRYTLRKRRGTKKLSLSVRSDGTVTLSVPWWVSAHVAARFMEEKRAWLVDVLAGVPSDAPEVGIAHYREHREAARRLIEARLRALNEQYGLSWGRVAIRRNASSWGSCSAKKNLNFDYRLLFLPPDLRDYVIVHELCHLAELNHSPRFWALVARVVPGYRAVRARLRRLDRTALGTGVPVDKQVRRT